MTLDRSGSRIDHLNVAVPDLAAAVAFYEPVLAAIGITKMLEIPPHATPNQPTAMTGFGLAHWMMENRPAVPVLLASGDFGKARAQQELWGAEIMPKPYDFDSVVRRIHAAIETRMRRTA